MSTSIKNVFINNQIDIRYGFIRRIPMSKIVHSSTENTIMKICPFSLIRSGKHQEWELSVIYVIYKCNLHTNYI
uniref:Uncharacterized protein n=1 Tax=Megaselia scalaris TaxID=36166 RepID=T1GHW1_MEGSC